MQLIVPQMMGGSTVYRWTFSVSFGKAIYSTLVKRCNTTNLLKLNLYNLHNFFIHNTEKNKTTVTKNKADSKTYVTQSSTSMCSQLNASDHSRFTVMLTDHIFTCRTLETRSNSFVIHRRSIAERGGCFQRCLFACLFVCLHDNFRTTKHRMMKLGG